MPDSPDLMPIGRFSVLSRLSIRMLRHYDANGVLVPQQIDPWTGYRRYASGQLIDAIAIRDLRDAGFGVTAIGELLAVRGTPSWDEALQVQRRALIDEARANKLRLELVDRLLNPPRETASITVTKETIPMMTVVALRSVVPTYEDEGILWERMMPVVAEQDVRPIGPCGVIEYNDEYTESDVDLSIFMPVEPGTKVEAPLELLNLPARKCVIATVCGSYDQFPLAHDVIAEMIAKEGLNPDESGSAEGHAFNIYLTEMGEVPENELETKIYQPLSN